MLKLGSKEIPIGPRRVIYRTQYRKRREENETFYWHESNLEINLLDRPKPTFVPQAQLLDWGGCPTPNPVNTQLI